MANLIDLDEALRQLDAREEWQPKNGVCVKNSSGQNCAPVESLKSFLRNRPVTDVAPIIHAYWIPVPNTYDSKKCSHCGAKCARWTYCNTDFCGACGAKMDAPCVPGGGEL